MTLGIDMVEKLKRLEERKPLNPEFLAFFGVVS